MCSALSVIDQVSHLHKTADIIIVLYVLIFMLGPYTKRVHRSVLNGSRSVLNLIFFHACIDLLVLFHRIQKFELLF